MRVLFLSHTFYGSNFLVGSHKLAKEMVVLGSETWHVSTPLRKNWIRKYSGENKLRSELSGQVHSVDGVSTYIPEVKSIPHFYQIDRDQVLVKSGLPKFDLIVIDQPIFLLSAVKLNRRTGAQLIYRPTDKFNRLDLVIFSFFTRRFAKLIIATNKRCFNKSFYRHSKKPIYIRPNGIDSHAHSHLNRKIKYSGIKERKLSAVYIGAIDNRIDWIFLSKLYTTGCFAYIDLFGPSKVARVESQGISLCGVVKHRDVSNVLKSYDFGILPFRDTRRNSSRSPMKLTEYLLNGLKVIATPNFVVPDEMKQFEAAILSREQHLNKTYIEKFARQEIQIVLKEDLNFSLSFESTARLILELGSSQT